MPVNILAIVFTVTILSYGCTGKQEEGPSRPRKERSIRDKLIEYLITDYNKLSDPGSLNVTFSISLQSLELDEEKEILNVNTWNNMQWVDKRLAWTPSDFVGVQTIRLPSDVMWIPDIMLYNSHSPPTMEETKAVIYTDGTVNLVSPTYIKALCPIDRASIDGVQVCSLKFGSWTYDGTYMPLQAGAMDLSSYVANSKYNLVDATGVTNVMKYECCVEEYHDYTVTLTLKKRP